MSSRLQLDVSNLSLGRLHLLNAYEVKAAFGVIAGNTVWSMPEHFRGFTTRRYTNALYLPTVYSQQQQQWHHSQHIPLRRLRDNEVLIIKTIIAGCTILIPYH